jgi:predicted RNase H-like HicB family nuclease
MQCIVEHPVVIEFDPETGHYTGTVPGIPNIVVDAKSERAAVKLAREAIGIWLAGHRPTVRAKVVSVNVD